MNWPPSYTVKTHPRCRSVKLKTSIKKGLEVIIPPRFNQNQIPAILEKHKSWIHKHAFKIEKALEKLSAATVLPEEINLRAIKQIYVIKYIQSDNKKLQLFIRPDNEIVLAGDVQNKNACKALLVLWIKRQAKLHLTILLQLVSLQTQLAYKSVSIRSQETRWGSCSSDKRINLNYKLIFLPEHLVRHILVHELCHTVHLNHSKKFWKLVAELDSNWKEHSREARRADSYVPCLLGHSEI